MKILRKKFIPYLWLLLLHLLLLIPLHPSKENELIKIPNLDKLIHLGIYAILTALWTIFIYQKATLSKQEKITWSFVLFLLAVADGIMIEFLQQLPIIHRDFDWFDALADGIGSAIGVFIGHYYEKMSTKKPLWKQGP